MEIERTILTRIRKLIEEEARAVRRIHLSVRAEQELRGYMTTMYGKSFRTEQEKIDDPLKKLLGYPVQIHPEPTGVA